MTAAAGVPVSVLETAGEGGAWGIALLASYMLERENGEALEDYLDQRIFAGKHADQAEPDPEDVKGFAAFMERFSKGLPIERGRPCPCLTAEDGQQRELIPPPLILKQPKNPDEACHNYHASDNRNAVGTACQALVASATFPCKPGQWRLWGQSNTRTRVWRITSSKGSRKYMPQDRSTANRYLQASILKISLRYATL